MCQWVLEGATASAEALVADKECEGMRPPFVEGVAETMSRGESVPIATEGIDWRISRGIWGGNRRSHAVGSRIWSPESVHRLRSSGRLKGLVWDGMGDP